MYLFDHDQAFNNQFVAARRVRAAEESRWLMSRRAGAVGLSPASNPAEIREERIREAAYLRAERRGFEAGHELDDWLAAQEEVDRTTRPISAR